MKGRESTLRNLFVHEWFRQIAEKNGHAIAIECGEMRVCYAELLKESLAWASRLSRLPQERENVVCICTEECSLVVAAMLATLQAGYAFCFLDPALPNARLTLILKDANPRCVITSSEWSNRVEVLRAVSECHFEVLTRESLDRNSKDCPEIERKPDDLCYLFYTSGSSGTPKAIAGRLKAIDHYIRWEIEALRIAAPVRVSQLIAHSFDACLRDIFLALCSGGTMCVPPDRETVMNGEQLADWLDKAQVEVVHCVPTLFRALLPFVRRPEQFAALKHVLLSGEPIWPADLKAWTQTMGTRIQLVNLYGPSETTMTKFAHFITPSDQLAQSVPIGRPISGAKAIIMDDKQRPCPDGTVGEIYIRTPYRSLGYWKRPELTQQVFVPNPFRQDPADLVYRTGDLGRVNTDGNLEFIGRIDKQVKIHGYRIELGEVESLATQFPFVRECVVVAKKQGNEMRLVAYCTSNAEGEPGLDLASLRNHLRKHLPEYMVPGACVLLPEMPLTANGKTDRRVLEEMEYREACEADEMPRSPEEDIISGIWTELLKVERVGVHENFFAIGGHSLLATQVISRMRKIFDVQLSLGVLFDTPTISELAREVRAAYRRNQQSAPPISRTEIYRELPLSFSQQRLWFIDQLNPGNAAYHMCFGLRIRGALAKDSVWKSVREIVRRHEVLRTSFPAREGQPVQEISEDPTVETGEVDLRHLQGEQQQFEAQKLIRDHAEKRFDMARGPLVRVLLLQLNEHEHLLLVTMHHIVSDGWSVGVVANEFGRMYRADVNGEASPLPPLTIQYKDFARWQREWLRDEALEQQLTYWKKHLESMEVLELPTDYPRPAMLSQRGGELKFGLSIDLTKKLAALTQSEGATLFMTLVAGFQTLLARYSGQTNITVGTAIANRNHIETEPLIGCFASTLVLQVDLDDDGSVRELLRNVRRTTLEAYRHQDVPFEKIVEELAISRDLSRTPIFQVMFVLQNMPQGAVNMEGLDLEIVPLQAGFAKFDLTVALAETPAGIEGVVTYSTDLFTQPTVERMMKHYERLLSEMVRDADCTLGALVLLSDAEKLQLTKEWNMTAVEYPFIAVPEMFSLQASRTPQAPALVYGGRRMDYQTLEKLSNQLAHRLQSLGGGQDTIVAVCLPRTLEMVIALLGVLKAGAAYLPIDPDYPEKRLEYLFQDAGARIVLTTDSIRGQLPLRELPVICLTPGNDSLQGWPSDFPGVKVEREQLAYVIYTSGSTGNPKAAAISHQALSNYLHWSSQAYELNKPGMGSPVHTKLTFDLTVTSIFPALITGKCLDLLEEPDGLVQAMKEPRQYSLIKLTPAHLRMLGGGMAEAARILVVGGEALFYEDVREWVKLGVVVVNEYGPTEATVGCCTYSAEASFSLHGPVPIGRPIANVQLYVLDRKMNPVPMGANGELYIGGAGLARGYLNLPGLTADRFRPNPFSSQGERLYRTGDRVRFRPDGNLIFLGRLDNQLKLRGFRIEPDEIEAQLRRHQDVTACAVVLWGEYDSQKLVAYVECREGTNLTPRQLQVFCREHLPNYMVPGDFVVLDQLAMTPHGKIDRQKLPAPDFATWGQQYVAPRTAEEGLLCSIFEEVLKRERIGIADNFFEMGGHSLLATQVVSRILKIFGTDVPIRVIFESPTVEQLAEQISTLAPDTAAPLPNGLHATNYPALEQLLDKIENLDEAGVDHLLALRNTKS
jgi:amino acid adenylation domain-containing protein